MTPSELKSHVEAAHPESFFFTRSTMRFFGDTMANYGVRSATVRAQYAADGNTYLPEGRDVEVWLLYRKHPVKHWLQGSAYFDKVTFRQVHGAEVIR